VPAHRIGAMSLTRDDVAHLADLARIDLSAAELDRMLGELTVILDSVAVVQQAPTDGVEPMSHPLPLTNVTRPDVPRPGLTAQEALAGAPATEQQRFSVPRILTED
jgi:aspartyl-tRNA(Asn)/glutamyl-tRNA(Gln) amidotransferase subunit C